MKWQCPSVPENAAPPVGKGGPGKGKQYPGKGYPRATNEVDTGGQGQEEQYPPESGQEEEELKMEEFTEFTEEERNFLQ